MTNPNCREWLRANGHPYPRSGCNGCRQRLNFTNCPHIKTPASSLWQKGTPTANGIWWVRSAQGVSVLVEIDTYKNQDETFVMFFGEFQLYELKELSERGFCFFWGPVQAPSE